MTISNTTGPENQGPVKPDPRQQAELEAALKARNNRRFILNMVILVAVILAIGAGYLFVYKPYSDSVKSAMKFVNESEQFVAQGKYDQAIQSLNKARIASPRMKALYYRAGLVYMHKKMQMQPEDYANAEEMFKMEIENNGHVAGAELALGFMYLIDGLIQDSEIPIESKVSIIDELSTALGLEITLKTDLNSLGLSESGGYMSAVNHFNSSFNAQSDFEAVASIGLAYAHALNGSRDDGRQNFEYIEELSTQVPILAKFYESSDSRLGVPSDEAVRIFTQAQQLAMEGRYDEALGILEDAKTANPDLDGISYYAGMINLLKMDFEQASDLFKKEFEEDGYMAKSEIALGFLYTVDTLLKDKSIPLDVKKGLIEEISSALKIDIALKSSMEDLDLGDNTGYDKAIEHFEKANNNTHAFSKEGAIGLAYVYALDMKREKGRELFNGIDAEYTIPVLREYYENNQPSLPVAFENVAGPKPPQFGVEELPPTSDETDIPDLPDIGIPKPPMRESPPWKEPRSFVIEPTVKPFKLSEYQDKNGQTKLYLTLLNIKESGKTIAREGQTRKMPKTGVEVTVIKLSEEKIITKEDNLHTFTWERNRNTWFVTEKS